MERRLHSSEYYMFTWSWIVAHCWAVAKRIHYGGQSCSVMLLLYCAEGGHCSVLLLRLGWSSMLLSYQQCLFLVSGESLWEKKPANCSSYVLYSYKSSNTFFNNFMKILISFISFDLGGESPLTTEVSLHVLSVIHLWSLTQVISGQTFSKGTISKAFYKVTFSEEFTSIFLATFWYRVLILCPKLAMQDMLVSVSWTLGL